MDQKYDFTGRQFVEKMVSLWDSPPPDGTVDRFVAGNPDGKVTGIGTTFIASMDCLREAVRRDVNLIITHEPTFFNHLDDLAFNAGDPVTQAKLDYVNEHGLMLYRFHDLMHRVRPDLIHEGVRLLCDWPPPERDERGINIVHTVARPLAELAAFLRDRTGGEVVRYIGDPHQQSGTLALCLGAPGYDTQIRAFANPEVDTLVIGECAEWAAGEYVRDACACGRRLGMILLGHRNSEEAGMAWICQELARRLNVNLIHLVVKDPLHGFV